MNFARLNHILIPTTAAERDRLRRSRTAWLVRPGWWLYSALSEEGRALAILLLFVGSASVDVARTQVYVLWSVLSGLLVGALMVRRAFSMPRVRLAARVPPRVTAGETMQIELQLDNDGDTPRHNVRVRRPFLPWDGVWVGRAPSVRELRPGASVRVETAARFVQRGHHHLDAFVACQLAPFALSVGPEITSGQCRFVVLPRPARIRGVSPLSPARADSTGDALGRRVAEEGDLSGVRPYRIGDRVRDLHAGTWARTGSPHVRTYEPECRLRACVVFDSRGTLRDEEAFEAAVSVAAGLVVRLAGGETLVELVLVGQTVTTVTVERGAQSVGRALDALARVEAVRHLPKGALSEAIRARLGGVSALWIVGATDDELAREAARTATTRGIRCRPVVVLPRRGALRAASEPGRHVVVAEDVHAGREIDL